MQFKDISNTIYFEDAYLEYSCLFGVLLHSLAKRSVWKRLMSIVLFYKTSNGQNLYKKAALVNYHCSKQRGIRSISKVLTYSGICIFLLHISILDCISGKKLNLLIISLCSRACWTAYYTMPLTAICQLKPMTIRAMYSKNNEDINHNNCIYMWKENA